MDSFTKATICFLTIFMPVILFSWIFLIRDVLQQGLYRKIGLDFHHISETSYSRRVKEALLILDGIGMDSWCTSSGKPQREFVISTYCGATGADKVKRCEKINGKYEEMLVDIPPAMKSYNGNMGGVYLSDQLIQCYTVLNKARKWWNTLLLHFINVCVVNSCFILKSARKWKNTTEFWKKLVLELLEQGRQANRSRSTGRPCRTSVCADQCPVSISEAPLNRSTKLRCRRNCKLCFSLNKNEQKTWKCGNCNFPLSAVGSKLSQNLACSCVWFIK